MHDFLSPSKIGLKVVNFWDVLVSLSLSNEDFHFSDTSLEPVEYMCSISTMICTCISYIV